MKNISRFFNFFAFRPFLSWHFLKFFFPLFLSCNDVFAQKDFSVFQYTSKNGLPQNSVKSMIMDDNGFLWMTTEGGLVRFDGVNFKVFNHANTAIMKTDRLRS